VVNSTTVDMPLVSVCILAFNHENYIQRAINSVLKQSYSNIEIIVVDNNSSDRTVENIKNSFSSELNDKRIALHQLCVNTFPSHGTNFGLTRAKGQYICLLSGDDSFAHNKVERQLEVMTELGLSNLFTWVHVINDSDDIINNSRLEAVFNKEYSSKDIKEHFVRKGNMLCALSGMFNRDIFEIYGGFDERLLQLQDFDLWLKIIANEDINLLPEKLTNYRKRNDEGNLSLIPSDERIVRTEFEEIFSGRHISNFDCDTLSSALNTSCCEENKHSVLIDYYVKKGRLSLAMGVLLSQYDGLGEKIDFPSETYQSFFNSYSKVNFFRITSRDKKKRKGKLLIKLIRRLFGKS